MSKSKKPDGSQVFHVVGEDVNRTLSSFLKIKLPNESWNSIKKIVHSRRIQINGNLCLDDGRRLKENDVVKLFGVSLAKPPDASDIKIVAWDDCFVVVEKPSGMTSTRHAEEEHWSAKRKQIQETLDELLPFVLAGEMEKEARKHRREDDDRRSRSGRNQNFRIPDTRAVHRLDRDTSGLMVFARNDHTEQSLIRQFTRHTIHRAYHAIVHGQIEAQTIENFLVRDRGDGLRGSGEEKKGQKAITHIKPLQQLKNFTLIECRLETGRTHQIRIHTSELGHFVCGDKMYCRSRTGKSTIDRSGAPRLALHAAELAFTHPMTGQRLEFKSSFPPDLKKFWAKLCDEDQPPPQTTATPSEES